MTKPKKPRGFAAIKAKNPDKHREIAANGGRNVDPAKRSFARDPDLAKRAGSQSWKNRKPS